MSIFANKALLRDGWADRVRLTVDDGKITAIEQGVAAQPDDILGGIVIPGMANAHSHAFQRALAGHTEHRGPDDEDNFWSWRTRMYELAGHVDAETLTAIARQAYVEMLQSGYTSVAEFHYLHSEPAGKANDLAMLRAIVTAARESGIRLTYIPILYQRAGFDQAEPNAVQQRFAMSTDDFVQHYEAAKALAGSDFRVGLGAHSLRAADLPAISTLADIAARDKVPMHIHIAEQTAEVDQCVAKHGVRPVELLLREFSPDENWCLVHATHMTDDELQALAKTGAVICICPSTEANLGDGLFPLQRWLASNGRFAIGSDSHISINPFEELRWLEYGQRLKTQSRNVAAIHGRHTGRSLFEQAIEGGARACGYETAVLHVGGNADLVILDDESPMLVGHDGKSLLDALVFSGFTLPIDRVMVNGDWRVLDGEPLAASQSRKSYARAIGELQAKMDPAS